MLAFAVRFRSRCEDEARKILMSGLSTDLCRTSAVTDGYEAHFVTDISSTRNERVGLAAVTHTTQGGMVMTNLILVAAEIQGSRKKRADTAQNY